MKSNSNAEIQIQAVREAIWSKGVRYQIDEVAINVKPDDRVSLWCEKL